jgi:hypothetical protein
MRETKLDGRQRCAPVRLATRLHAPVTSSAQDAALPYLMLSAGSDSFTTTAVVLDVGTSMGDCCDVAVMLQAPLPASVPQSWPPLL